MMFRISQINKGVDAETACYCTVDMELVIRACVL